MDFEADIIYQSACLKKVASRVLKLTCERSNESEVSIIKTTGITISTRLGQIENVEFHNNEVLEVIVFLNKKKGTASSNNLNNDAIHNVVDEACNVACYTSSDLCAGIADKNLLAFDPANLDLYHPINLDIKLGAHLASQSERSALKYDKRIVCTDGGKFNSYFITKVFGNSHGMLSSYSSSQYILSCSAIAESNGVMEQNYVYTLNRSVNNLRSSEWIGQECARGALKKLGSKKIKTMESPVLFVSEMATDLFKYLASAIHGSNVYRQSTFLLNDLEKPIFPDWMFITEFPHILQGLGSAPFDNEGVQTSDYIIIKNGILKNWLLDTRSACKLGLKSSGHSGGIYNWNITNQDVSFNELIQNMYRGLIVMDLMGQGVNIMTGDYSKGVSGFWVDYGEIQYPVNEITISGNLKQMFHDILCISNDIEIRSNIHCGSVLISSMKIAGL